MSANMRWDIVFAALSLLLTVGAIVITIGGMRAELARNSQDIQRIMDAEYVRKSDLQWILKQPQSPAQSP